MTLKVAMFVTEMWLIKLQKLYSQTVGIPMGTNCAPLVADLFICFVMRGTSCCLCQTILKLVLLKLLTPHSDI